MKEEILPDIVAIKTIDENVTAEVQEVYSGSSHRHLRSSVSTSKISDEAFRKKINQKRWFRRRSVEFERRRSNRETIRRRRREEWRSETKWEIIQTPLWVVGLTDSAHQYPTPFNNTHFGTCVSTEF